MTKNVFIGDQRDRGLRGRIFGAVDDRAVVMAGGNLADRRNRARKRVTAGLHGTDRGI